MDVVLQSRPPEYGPVRFHPKAASGQGCVTVLLLPAMENGGPTLGWKAVAGVGDKKVAVGVIHTRILAAAAMTGLS